ncbi:MAG: hypothetical protein M0002_16255 [Rhodospirillales bacterium]|nr:hypothetical protein [Rhodospirillales bacterium]MDA8051527.1 hypothetical protein [Rhodospirillales bacterium]
MRAVGAPGGGPPPYQMIALLDFGSRAEFERAVGTHGPEILGDVPHFTSVQPVLQFNETTD